MSRVFSRKSGVAGAMLLLLSAAGAYAYFTQTGSGTGAATTGSGSPVVVIQTSTITTLTPGGTQNLSGNFNNPNPGRIHVASVSATIASVTDVAGDPITGCTTADYAITNSPATVNLNIAAGNGVGSWGGVGGPTLGMVDANANQDACKGAIVHLAYTSA